MFSKAPSFAFGKRASRMLMAFGLAALLTACKSEIYSSVPERDAAEMTSILNTAGIEASRERLKSGQFSISVPSSQAARATALMAQRGLPRQQFETLGTIFDAKRMVSTPFEERARFMHAINQELANSLTQISGVISARVHVMLPESSPLERERQSPRASVFVYHLPDVPMAPHVPVIKNLVVNAVNGLNYEDVAIALFPQAPAGYSGSGLFAGLPSGNHIVLILLMGILAVMFFARQSIGRAVGQFLSRAG